MSLHNSSFSAKFGPTTGLDSSIAGLTSAENKAGLGSNIDAVVSVPCPKSSKKRVFESEDERVSHRKAYQAAYRLANKEKEKAYQAEYRFSHREKSNATTKEWKKNNKERTREWRRTPEQMKKNRDRSKAWRTKNREKARLRTSEWRTANPERQKANMRSWLERNRDKVYANIHKRRAIQHGADCGETKLIATWRKTWRSKPTIICHWCRKESPSKKAHGDHIIPLSRGGLHCLSNLCVSCAFCNLSKKDRLPSEWKRLAQPVLL